MSERLGPFRVTAVVAVALALSAVAGYLTYQHIDPAAEPDASSWAEPVLPERPGDLAWLTYGTDDGGVIVVPGRDILLMTDNTWDETTVIAALSTEDGEPIWRYEHDGYVRGLAVDPDQGRMLAVAGDAVVLLDLEDGSEVDVRESPVGSALSLHGHGLTGFRDPGPTVTLGATALVIGGGETRPAATDTGPEERRPETVGVVEVATGAALAVEPVPHHSCKYSMAGVAGEGMPPVVLQWGAGTGCREPTLLGVDTSSGTLEPLVTIEPPDGAWAGCTDGHCETSQLLGDADALALSLAWNPLDPEEDVVREVVGVVEEQVAWRIPVPGTGPANDLALVDVVDDSLLAKWDGKWRRVSMSDGEDLVPPVAVDHDDIPAPGAFSVVATGRLYTTWCGHLVVRTVDDLALIGIWDGYPSSCETAGEDVGNASLTEGEPASEELPMIPNDPSTRSDTFAGNDGLLFVHDRRTRTLYAFEERGDRPDDAGPVDAAAPATDGVPGSPVTPAELGDVSIPFSHGPDALPPLCAHLWSGDRTPADDGFSPETEAITLDQTSGGLSLGDVDGDGIDDGLAVFQCTVGGNKPPTGVLVLLASDRSLVSNIDDELTSETLRRYDDRRHHIAPPIEIVPPQGSGTGQVVAAVHLFRPEDPNCCPSLRGEVWFVLEDDGLRLTDLTEVEPATE